LFQIGPTSSTFCLSEPVIAEIQAVASSVATAELLLASAISSAERAVEVNHTVGSNVEVTSVAEIGSTVEVASTAAAVDTAIEVTSAAAVASTDAAIEVTSAAAVASTDAAIDAEVASLLGKFDPVQLHLSLPLADQWPLEGVQNPVLPEPDLAARNFYRPPVNNAVIPWDGVIDITDESSDSDDED